jgi:hypothetical protein
LLRADQIRRLAQKAGILALAGALGVLLLDLGPHVEIVMKAAGIPKNATGIGGFVNGAHALVRWQAGDMRKRWTAAGMLVAEQRRPQLRGRRARGE